MLARLERESGVTRAEVDRYGKLLRITLLDAAEIDPVVARLQEMGFIGDVIPHGVAAQRWYDQTTVGELSGEEAAVIARRVIAPFVRNQKMPEAEGELIAVVTAALHQCFVTSFLDVGASTHSLDDSCGRAVRAATRTRLGEERAAALGQAIEADLAGHRGSPK